MLNAQTGTNENGHVIPVDEWLRDFLECEKDELESFLKDAQSRSEANGPGETQYLEESLKLPDQLIEACSTDPKQLSLTKDQKSWLIGVLESNRQMRMEELENFTDYDKEQFIEFELYRIYEYLQILVPIDNREDMEQLEGQMKDVLNRMDYGGEMKPNDIPPSFLNTMMKLAEHISRPCYQKSIDLLRN